VQGDLLTGWGDDRKPLKLGKLLTLTRIQLYPQLKLVPAIAILGRYPSSEVSLHCAGNVSATESELGGALSIDHDVAFKLPEFAIWQSDGDPGDADHHFLHIGSKSISYVQIVTADLDGQAVIPTSNDPIERIGAPGSHANFSARDASYSFLNGGDQILNTSFSLRG